VKKIGLIIAVLLLGWPLMAQRTWCVKQGLSGNGSSWEKAFGSVQDALEVAQKGDEIWVAAGKYLPTQDGDRSKSFVIKDGITLLGGFAGFETEADQRDYRVNLTVLSGDIGEASPMDNSYTVVYISNVSSATVIDGFVIADGEAKGGLGEVGDATGCGAGIFNVGDGQESNPVIKNCRVVNNYAFYGGGIFNYSPNNGTCKPTIIDTEFELNIADLDGGAIYNYGVDGHSYPTIRNSKFVRNQADYGAVIYTEYPDCQFTPNMSNCQFEYNVAYTRGAVYYDQFSPEGPCNTKVVASLYNENKASVGILAQESQQTSRDKAAYR
jgi:hypothetical protein